MATRTRLQTLLLAVVEAQATAETVGHPAAQPLAAFAETLRHGEDQPEIEHLARVFAGWFTLADHAENAGYLLTTPTPQSYAAVPEPRDAES